MTGSLVFHSKVVYRQLATSPKATITTARHAALTNHIPSPLTAPATPRTAYSSDW